MSSSPVKRRVISKSEPTGLDPATRNNTITDNTISKSPSAKKRRVVSLNIAK